jgi:hypothetical protein
LNLLLHVQEHTESFRIYRCLPPDAEVALKRFTSTPPYENEVPEIGEHEDSIIRKQLCNLYEAIVKDTEKVHAKRLASALHSLQVQNELLHNETEGLHEVLITKRKHTKKSKPLDLQQRKDYWVGAVFWSPRKLREAKARDAVKQREEEKEKLRKSDDKNPKEKAPLHRKQQQKSCKRGARKCEGGAQEGRGSEGCGTRGRESAKTAGKGCCNHAKISLYSKKSQTSSLTSARSNKRSRSGVIDGGSGAAAASPPPQLPPRMTTRRRQINLPQNFT